MGDSGGRDANYITSPGCRWNSCSNGQSKTQYRLRSTPMPLPAAVKKALVGPQGWRAGWRFLAFAGLWYWLVASDYGVFALVVKIYTFSDTGFTPMDLLVSLSVSAVTVLALSAFLARL